MKKAINVMENAKVFIVELGLKLKETKKETATSSKTEEAIQKGIKAFVKAVEKVEKRGAQFQIDPKTMAALEGLHSTKPPIVPGYETKIKEKKLDSKKEHPPEKEDKRKKPT
jgi:hypothetical protein